ncbi:MAG: class I SAM-dependent methyltransferase [Vicinamibacterales bacterium]
MSGFSAEWLALREPADRAARSVDVTRFVLASVARETAPVLVDLGCGTGSNVRYLAPQIPGCRWRLVDDDEQLLSVARASLSYPVEIHRANLLTLNDRAMEGCALVTASALLDLVSEEWLARLVAVAMTRQTGCAVLMALNWATGASRARPPTQTMNWCACSSTATSRPTRDLDGR